MMSAIYQIIKEMGVGMPRKSTTNKQKCDISEKIDELEKEYIRSKVCQSLSADYEHEGKLYCLLHYPSLDKTEAFDKEFQKRLDAEDYNFRGVYFPIVLSLFNKKFEKHIDFISATFMKDVRISSSSFTLPVNFIGANFMGYTSFFEVTFLQYVSFHSANFDENSDTYFSKTKFEGEVDFSYANLKGYVTFVGEQDNPPFVGENAFLNLQNARIENPERILFHSVRLQPNWFINQESSKNLIFTNCTWLLPNGEYISPESEYKALKKREIQNAYELLGKTCWQLAENHEENKLFNRASFFRKMANETKRLNKNNKIKIWHLHWWYWLLSYYGEDWKRALAVLFLILAVFTGIYALTEFQSCPNTQPLAVSITECKNEPENCKCRNGGLRIKEAVAHSLSTALFQNVEHRKPLTVGGELATYLEKILAPLQAALLALAIRRKFMR